MKQKNQTLNLPEYNQETGKHTITLEITPTTKSFDCKLIDRDLGILSWKSVIQDALQERLMSCKNSLAAAVLRDEVLSTLEDGITYLKGNLVRHYSYSAAEAMERVISELNDDKLAWLEDLLCTQQVLKALAWIPLDKRITVNGYPYQVLVDILWECHIAIRWNAGILK